jgi:hypothetical protein
MSDFQAIFKTCFDPLYGRPAWQVSHGHGSFLTMEFGAPQFDARNRIHGEWHLWIYCCNWQVFDNNKLVGDAALKSSSKRRIIRAANHLDGRKLTGASISEYGQMLTLDFESGARLVTKPYDNDSVQWYLFGPCGKCLVVRADRQFKYDSSNSSEPTWCPIQI